MKWTEEQIKVLEENYSETGSEIEKLMKNRSREAIRTKAKRLGLRKEKKAEEPSGIDKSGFSAGYLVGSIIGDGCIKKHEARISFTQKDEDYIDKLIDEFEELTSKKPSKYFRQDGYYEISYNSSIWIKEFKRLIEMVLDGENNKEEFKIGYVAGLFDSEGSVTNNNQSLALRCGMTKKKPMKIYSKYLRSLGIKTKFKESKTSYDKQKSLYLVSIYRYSEVKKFGETVPLSIQRKQKKIDKHLNNNNSKYKTWTEKEIELLKNKYPEEGTNINLNRPDGSIRSKASELDIKYKR